MFVLHKTISNSTRHLHKIADEQLETKLITSMRDADYRRTIALHTMNATEDPKQRNQAIQHIQDINAEFHAAREQIFSKPRTPQEKKAWKETDLLIKQGETFQHRVLKLIEQKQHETARHLLAEEVIPRQDTFVNNITNTLNIQRMKIEEDLAEAVQHNNQSDKLLALLGSIAMTVGVFMIFVIKRTRETENAVLEQGNRIRALYGVTSKSGLLLVEQINEMLNIGCQLLNMQCGRIFRIDSDVDVITVLNTSGTEYCNDLPPGTTINLDETLCAITYKSKRPTAIHDTQAPQFLDQHKCFQSSNVNAYIGAPIVVSGKNYGTVNFSSTNKRSKPFAETDKDLVNLISSWASVAIERQLEQQEIREAKEAAEFANQTKSAFLANMSHELRTPLNAIIGYSEMLVEESVEAGDKQSADDLGKINTSGHHLLSLIDDVLDLSKIEAGRMDISLELTNVSPIIDEVTSTLQPFVDKKGNKLTINMGVKSYYIRTDKTRFKQILYNLLSNANKFTKNGRLTLNIMPEQKNGSDWIIIEVKDTGIGMSPKQISRLFEAFTQADPSIGKEFGGTGLGLAISRSICKMMGGEIFVESTEGLGSTFTVVLPVSRSSVNTDAA